MNEDWTFDLWVQDVSNQPSTKDTTGMRYLMHINRGTATDSAVAITSKVIV